MRTFNASMAVQSEPSGEQIEPRKNSACQILRNLAARTWEDIREGDEADIRIGEESITDRLLLDIKRGFPLSTSVVKWNRFDEGRRTGADFDWWFVDPVEVLGVGLRIQAKRIDYFEQEFPGLRKRNRHGSQLGMLRRSAAAANCHPLYLFYLASRIPRAGVTACGSYGSGEAPPGWNGEPNQIYGCSLVGTAGVQAALAAKDQSLDFFWPQLLPWSCLACCERMKGGLVQRVDQQARRARLLGGDSEEEPPESLITEAIPAEVWAVIDPEDRRAFLSPPDVGATLVTLVPPARFQD